MPVNCRKYKTSRQHVHECEPAYLAAFLEKQMPGAQFRFITFEKDDYKRASLTFLLCHSMPEKVTIAVESGIDLEAAIRQIIVLNPSVRWDNVNFIYPSPKDSQTGNTTVELMFNDLSMVINSDGIRYRD